MDEHKGRRDEEEWTKEGRTKGRRRNEGRKKRKDEGRKKRTKGTMEQSMSERNETVKIRRNVVTKGGWE